MYLKACGNYGLKEQDLFQVNDLYENKNLYMVVDNLYNLGGMVRQRDQSHQKMTKNQFLDPKERLGWSNPWC